MGWKAVLTSVEGRLKVLFVFVVMVLLARWRPYQARNQARVKEIGRDVMATWQYVSVAGCKKSNKKGKKHT